MATPGGDITHWLVGCRFEPAQLFWHQPSNGSYYIWNAKERRRDFVYGERQQPVNHRKPAPRRNQVYGFCSQCSQPLLISFHSAELDLKLKRLHLNSNFLFLFLCLKINDLKTLSFEPLSAPPPFSTWPGVLVCGSG